jgi:hypothetical protein
MIRHACPSRLEARPLPRRIWRPTLVAAALFAACGLALAGTIRSVGPLVFADGDTLVVADWRAQSLHALKLPPAAAAPSRPFNLRNVSTPIANALHVRPEQVSFEDMAFRPGAEIAYVSVSVDRGGSVPAPAIVSIDSGGKVSVLPLDKLAQTAARITSVPAADRKFWRDTPEATLTVTDLVFNGGKLYVAGLSNGDFASTLRIYDFPFDDHATATTVEMYHPVHDQLETRAPIRKMAVVDLDGVPSLVAAYTCTPLVVIALKDLVDGAHVKGTTIAELGWGSAPVDMLAFDTAQGPQLLLANSAKSADLMPVSAIAAAAKLPSLATPIQVPASPLLGLKSTYLPLTGLDQLAMQDAQFIGALRRQPSTGAMQLVSFRVGAFLRVSDFVNEYDFDDFHYRAGDPFRGAHQVMRSDEGYPELAARSAP